MRTALVFIVFILNFSIVSIAQQKEVNNIDSKGKKQGKWIKRDENGFITYIGVFKDDLPKGAFKYYYPTNDTVLKSLVIHSADGKTTWVSNYHFNKKIMSQGKYTDKLRDSSWVFYHEAGFKIAEENYSKGKLSGIRKLYFDNGNLLSECNYIDDKKDGTSKEYFDDGKIKVSGTYKLNKAEGKFTHYTPTGKIIAEGSYKEGLKHNIWTYYKQDGSFESKEVYENGDLLTGKKAEEFLNKKKKEDNKNNNQQNKNSNNNSNKNENKNATNKTNKKASNTGGK